MQFCHMQVRTYSMVPVNSGLGQWRFLLDTQPPKHAIVSIINPQALLVQKADLQAICHMQVRTYDVVPVSSSLGLVEFVPDTQPLKHAIMTFMDPEVHPVYPRGLPELLGHDTDPSADVSEYDINVCMHTDFLLQKPRTHEECLTPA